MRVETATRTVGTLTAADIGEHVRIEHEGWVHDGTLKTVEHDTGFRGDVRTTAIVEYPSGARKFLGGLSPHQPIEVATEVASDD